MTAIKRMNRKLVEQDIRMKREGRHLLIAVFAGAATFLGLSVALGKMFFGG